MKVSVRYDLRSILPDGWEGDPPLELASSNSYSMHSDFMMGWLPETTENMLADAVRGTEFVGVDDPDGSYDAGSVCGAANAKDEDPTHGTSNYTLSKEILAAEKSSSTKRWSVRGSNSLF